MRIVSLIPSATEILFAVGAGDDVVGVTFECDHPPAAREPISMTWKSSIRPSVERYMVIGDIAMRLRNVTPLRV